MGNDNVEETVKIVEKESACSDPEDEEGNDDPYLDKKEKTNTEFKNALKDFKAKKARV